MKKKAERCYSQKMQMLNRKHDENANTTFDKVRRFTEVNGLEEYTMKEVE